VTTDKTSHISLGLSAAVLVIAGLYFARSFFAPVVFSLFIMALVWPFQKFLQAKMPRPLARTIVILATLGVAISFASTLAWGGHKAGEWLLNNVSRFQSVYLQATHWLEDRGILQEGLVPERFDVTWIAWFVKEVAGSVNTLVGFFVLVFLLTMIGLLEVENYQKAIESMEDVATGRLVLRAAEEMAAKFRKYMLVRTLASILTGTLIWGFALFTNLEMAASWGIIAFALNHLPFIGPLVATILPALFAIVQFGSWKMALFIFISFSVVQFAIGNYIEPLISGAMLDMSPYMVVFAVFFWTFMWGIPGTFIGVPLTIAFLTICDQDSSTRWLAVLLSGRAKLRSN